MKRYYRIGLFLFVLFIGCKTPVKAPEDCAKADIRANTVQILVYGELKPFEDLENEVAKKYGFKYFRVAGCEVTENLTDSVNKYNTIVYKYLDSLNGNNWEEKFKEDIEALKK